MSQLVNSNTITWSETGNQLSANLSSTLTGLASLPYPPAAGTIVTGNGAAYVTQTNAQVIMPIAAALAIALGG